MINYGDVLVISTLVVVTGAIILNMIRSRKKGGGCAGCSGCSCTSGCKQCPGCKK